MGNISFHSDAKKVLSIEKIFFHNALDAFDYTYVGGTRRLAGVAAPNGLAAAFSYLPNGQDRRLAGIVHTGPGGVAVSVEGRGVSPAY